VSTIRSVPTDPKPGSRSPAQIEADIERTRLRLAGTVDAIADRVKPANVARRTADSAKSVVVDEDGYPRVARIAALGLGAAALAALFVWRRRR
jgi:MYXO-CTERM domain-containing protein